MAEELMEGELQGLRRDVPEQERTDRVAAEQAVEQQMNQVRTHTKFTYEPAARGPP